MPPGLTRYALYRRPLCAYRKYTEYGKYRISRVLPYADICSRSAAPSRILSRAVSGLPFWLPSDVHSVPYTPRRSHHPPLSVGGFTIRTHSSSSVSENSIAHAAGIVKRKFGRKSHRNFLLSAHEFCHNCYGTAQGTAQWKCAARYSRTNGMAGRCEKYLLCGDLWE